MPEGVPAEPSGYYGTPGGTLKVKLDLAANDKPGTWEIRATEGATGIETRVWLSVTMP